MVARVARFQGVDIAQAEKDMGEVEPLIRSLVSGLAGYRGDLHVWSAEGDMLSITLFESEADARAAEATFDEVMPQKLGDYFDSWQGRRTSVEILRAMGDIG